MPLANNDANAWKKGMVLFCDQLGIYQLAVDNQWFTQDDDEVPSDYVPIGRRMSSKFCKLNINKYIL